MAEPKGVRNSLLRGAAICHRELGRTVGSTITGQFVDTTTVILVAFVGRAPWGTILNLIISGYLFKVIYEVVATPITYWIVNKLKHAEGVDVYDRGTNFNPFARSREIISEAG